jgi:hypothetical protein
VCPSMTKQCLFSVREYGTCRPDTTQKIIQQESTTNNYVPTTHVSTPPPSPYNMNEVSGTNICIGLTSTLDPHTAAVDQAVYRLGYGLDDRASVPGRSRRLISSPRHRCVQTGSGAHLASYPTITAGSFPRGVKMTTHLISVPRF